MAHGIGVRYTASGARILGLERSDKELRITGLAAGLPEGSLETFITSRGLLLEDSVVACGLCPGDFLSAFIEREEDMDDTELQNQLRWEIERKMITGQSEYIVDFLIADRGYVFAGRKEFIKEMKGSFGKFVTDVEPVALLNGCESAEETGDGPVLLLSLEAEGISTVFLHNNSLIALESFPILEDNLSPVIAGLDSEGMKNIKGSEAERFADYALESINRLSAYTQNRNKIAPEKIIIAGSGVYIGGLAGMIEQKSGIKTTISDPFTILTEDISEKYPDLARMSAAFTTCFGLAVRALEE